MNCFSSGTTNCEDFGLVHTKERSMMSVPSSGTGPQPDLQNPKSTALKDGNGSVGAEELTRQTSLGYITSQINVKQIRPARLLVLPAL